ncbi:thioesterase superfamily protein [Williamsia muralis]|uniref:Thioesterase superfamily protein n=1 Tax=Williamsia marianensis TaxID=85044 RepID=A0A495K2M6_WILMA|nr:thioesterase superfamily protein [Williamsia muralis]
MVESPLVSAQPAYFIPLGHDGEFDHFEPTEHTVSVWGADLQHGGPPTGLLTRALLRHEPDASHSFTRIAIDILGPVGMTENRVSTTVLRPGRQISLLASELSVKQPDGSFRIAARATGWRLATADTATVEHAVTPALTPLPDELEGTIGLAGVGPLDAADWGSVGFVGTLEHRLIDRAAHGPSRAWVRPTLPLVAGEETTDLEKFFTVLDVANGVGSRLAIGDWTFMNTDTTVHLHRAPVGDWTGISAEMAVGPNGYGATFADLYDTAGPVGRSAQTVLIRPV